MRIAHGVVLGRNQLPADVQNLIERHLDSAAHVETLLLLCQEDRAWTAPAVARELRFDVDQTSNILARLARSKLLMAEGESYRFHPRKPDLARAVAKLAELYPTYRVAIVSLIYARPTWPAKDFSDAFRLRDED